jgi:hypothetical protein
LLFLIFLKWELESSPEHDSISYFRIDYLDLLENDRQLLLKTIDTYFTNTKKRFGDINNTKELKILLLKTKHKKPNEYTFLKQKKYQQFTFIKGHTVKARSLTSMGLPGGPVLDMDQIISWANELNNHRQDVYGMHLYCLTLRKCRN